MNALKKLNSIFYFISKKLGAFVLGTLVVVITIAVIARYFLGQPFTWTEELCTFLFIWFSFLGATLATYEKRHVSVDFLVTKLPKQVNNVVKLLSNILILAFFVLLVVGAFILFPTMQHVSVAENSQILLLFPDCTFLCDDVLYVSGRYHRVCERMDE